MSKPVPMYWEEFEVGAKFVTRARTVTETDIVMFAAMTGDYNPLHTDAEFMKTSIFGERIAHGLLGLAIGVGLVAGLGIAQGTVIAFLGINWNFTGPIRIGDTIHVEQTVAEKRETKKPDRGIIVWDMEVVNQRGEVVQKGQRTLMVRRRGEG
ncbi:MAG: MaoC/PaaZ C-terminal domain-containing protein [Chloroflexota bacterium]